MNRVCVIGVLAEDPQERRTGSGVAHARLMLDVEDHRHNYRIPVLVYGREGRSVLQYLREGSRVAVDGRICSRAKSLIVDVVADHVQFLDGPPISDARSDRRKE